MCGRAARRALIAALAITALVLGPDGTTPLPARGAPSSAPAAAGTLDRMAAEIQRELRAALRGRNDLDRTDIGIAAAASAGATVQLLGVVRRLLIARLTALGLRRVRDLGAAGVTSALRRRARTAGLELLLRFDLTVSEGYLHLRGELTDVSSSLWRDLVQPQPGTLSHLHASTRVDAEVRAYLGKDGGARRSLALRRFRCKKTAPLLALAAGDLDRDGRQELLMLRPRRIEAASFRGKAAGFSARWSIALPGDPAAVRSRRPVGVLLTRDTDGDGQPELLARSSELADGAVLSPGKGGKLRPTKTLRGFPLVSVPNGSLLVGELQRGMDRFSVNALRRPPDTTGRSSPTNTPASKPTAGSAPGARPETTPPAKQPSAGSDTAAPLTAPLPQLFYALRTATIATPGGPRSFAAVVDTSGALTLLSGDLSKRLATLDAAGVAFDLLDIDDDGRIDLAASTAASIDGEDRLLLLHATAGGKLQRFWRSPKLGGRVTAVTHGDFDGDGRQEVVAAVEDGHHCALVQVN